MSRRWMRHHVWSRRVTMLDTGHVVLCECVWWKRLWRIVTWR